MKNFSRFFESTALRFFVGWLLSFSWVVSASEINAVVTDQDGKPVADAVVLADALSAQKPSSLAPAPAEVDQIDKEFVPYVTPVQVGTLVNFPNKDNVRHHVYSFSAGKKFDLPLYSGTSAPPIVFDKPGIIVIGCNIHDWMIGYIYVAETKYFAKTNKDGVAILKDVPSDGYNVHIWHPDMKETEQQTSRSIDIKNINESTLRWQITLKPRVNERRGPTGNARDY